MGKEGQTVPQMSDEWVETISNRYIELYEKVTGTKFELENLDEKEIYQQITKAITSESTR